MQAEYRRVAHPSELRRPPKYATLPDLTLPTRGGKVRVLADEMGKPLLPHQQYIADVGTEMNPPGSPFLFRRRLIVVSLPRQTGKTTLQRPLFVERCMSRPQTKAFMCAQMGKYSSERWSDLVSDLESSPLFNSWTRIVRGKGSERCHFPNSSFISPFAPGPEALHGESPPIVSVDEGWAFSAEEGAQLMRAIRPAQQTLWDRQLWIFSAAGDLDSEWWEALCEAGRESINDPLSDMAYFEWAIADDADPYDPAAWDFHPGLDGLITRETLAEESQPSRNSHADWLRGFMNRSTKQRTKTVLDVASFATLAGPQPDPQPDQVAYAYDVALDRTAASVWSAWRTNDGRLMIQVVKTDEGADWLPEFIAGLYRAEPGATIGADDGGPTRMVTDRLTRAGIPVEVIGGRDAATAWGAFKAEAKATPARLVHDGSPVLLTQLEAAVERTIGDATSLSRRHSLGPIDAVVAAKSAAWLADHLHGPQLFV
ncbi:hypothetical protein [Actinotalea sp.]|uniref:hypothetical protein n=1 Tax=Actinotalea sp. TaxID=1872145 RepID=UPI0035668B34